MNNQELILHDSDTNEPHTHPRSVLDVSAMLSMVTEYF